MIPVSGLSDSKIQRFAIYPAVCGPSTLEQQLGVVWATVQW